MKISKEDYFFYEWLIIARDITAEKFEQLKPSELMALKAEYGKFEKALTMTGS